MATTYTGNINLRQPAVSDTNWGPPLNANAAILDGLAPLGGLCVTTAETPSTTLGVAVAAGTYADSAGTPRAYAGTSSPYLLPGSTASLLWLTDAGTLASGTSWPAAPHVRLASATTGASTVAAVVDARVAFRTLASGPAVVVATVTTAYTALGADGLIRGDASGGGFTVTLPAATAAPGHVVRVQNVGASGTVTVGSASLINGASTLALTSQWAGKTFVADAATNTWGAF